MTGHQINSLVGDLVAMAQAMERLPQVEAELNGVKTTNGMHQDTIQRLELKLMDAKNLEDTLRASIRDLEVARDDAELRFLELDERAAKAVRFLGQVQGMAVQAELELNPLKPEPQSEAIPHGAGAGAWSSDPQPSGQSASPPTSAPSAPIGTGTESVASSYEPQHGDIEADAKNYHAALGQSVVNPTDATPNTTEASVVSAPSVDNAIKQGSVPSDPTAHGSDGSTNESAIAQSQPAKPSEPAATKPWGEQDVKHD